MGKTCPRHRPGIVHAPCRQNSGLPEFGTLEWPKLDVSDFGCGTITADDFAYPTAENIAQMKVQQATA
jgi:hypothetical protein